MPAYRRADFLYTEQFTLESGQELDGFVLRYETWGTLSPARDNAILVLHAFSGDSHAASAGLAANQASDENRAGWWEQAIGPDRLLDTNRFFIVCANVIGGCMGSSGPGSIHPKTGKRWGLDFPLVTIEDMVRSQKLLIDSLGINTLLAVIGGSMGGMQALAWAKLFPHSSAGVAVLAAAPRLSAQAIAFNAVGRNAIVSDAGFHGGSYYGISNPDQGLAVARMIGHITYLSEDGMHERFGRKKQGGGTFTYDFGERFQVESYLEHQGEKFVERFDANTYVYLTKAMDYFDLGDHEAMVEAFAPSRASFMILSFSSDWLFPSRQSMELTKALLHADRPVSYVEIESPYGHDSFLLEYGKLKSLLSPWIDSLGMESLHE